MKTEAGMMWPQAGRGKEEFSLWRVHDLADTLILDGRPPEPGEDEFLVLAHQVGVTKYLLGSPGKLLCCPWRMEGHLGPLRLIPETHGGHGQRWPVIPSGPWSEPLFLPGA